MRKPTVVIEVEARVPRPRKDGRGMTRTRYRQWVSLGRWPVLYRDREIVLVRQFGLACLYDPDGDMVHVGYKRKHPKAHLIPANRMRWRIQPESLK